MPDGTLHHCVHLVIDIVVSLIASNSPVPPLLLLLLSDQHGNVSWHALPWAVPGPVARTGHRGWSNAPVPGAQTLHPHYSGGHNACIWPWGTACSLSGVGSGRSHGGGPVITVFAPLAVLQLPAGARRPHSSPLAAAAGGLSQQVGWKQQAGACDQTPGPLTMAAARWMQSCRWETGPAVRAMCLTSGRRKGADGATLWWWRACCCSCWHRVAVVITIVVIFLHVVASGTMRATATGGNIYGASGLRTGNPHCPWSMGWPWWAVGLWCQPACLQSCHASAGPSCYTNWPS